MDAEEVPDHPPVVDPRLRVLIAPRDAEPLRRLVDHDREGHERAGQVLLVDRRPADLGVPAVVGDELPDRPVHQANPLRAPYATPVRPEAPLVEHVEEELRGLEDALTHAVEERARVDEHAGAVRGAVRLRQRRAEEAEGDVDAVLREEPLRPPHLGRVGPRGELRGLVEEGAGARR